MNPEEIFLIVAFQILAVIFSFINGWKQAKEFYQIKRDPKTGRFVK